MTDSTSWWSRSMANLPTGTLTFLFGDIEGSSRLDAAHGGHILR